jgi:hypothetical protein
VIKELKDAIERAVNLTALSFIQMNLLVKVDKN